MNMIISQAMATGLPVITTRHSGLPEQVIDGLNGLLVEEGDFLALSDSILALAASHELWSGYARFARARAKANYDSNIVLEKQIRHYQSFSG